MHHLSTIFIIVLSIIICVGTLHAQWIQTNIVLTGRTYCFTGNETNLFAGTKNGVWRSTDSGMNWIRVNSGLTDTVARCLIQKGTRLFVGTARKGIFLSTNNGASWSPVNNGFGDSVVAGLVAYHDVLFAAAGSGYGGVYRSDDNGMSWYLTSNGLKAYFVYSLAASDSKVFAGTNLGVYISSDSGANWNLDTNGIGGYTESVFLLNDRNNLYQACGHFGGWVSTDGGDNWTNLGLTQTHAWGFAVNGSNLFAGTDSGVLVSTNNGISWTPINTGLTTKLTWALAVAGEYLLAGTYNHGIWRRPLSEITSADLLSEDYSSYFHLDQNYPNPFNPITTISYRLLRQTRVTLKVFDMLGREVTMLVHGFEEPGYKSVMLDASELSSGVYYYRLQAGKYIETKKLLLLR